MTITINEAEKMTSFEKKRNLTKFNRVEKIVKKGYKKESNFKRNIQEVNLSTI